MSEKNPINHGNLLKNQFYFRMHEQWDLPTPPDVVTFSKKMLFGGFFFREELYPKHVSDNSTLLFLVFLSWGFPKLISTQSIPSFKEM